MLQIQNEVYFHQTMAKAAELGQIDNLKKQLEFLDNYAGKEETRCVLAKDWAPLSFEFTMQRKQSDGTYLTWFCGGLIYHGKLDGYGSGAAPTFAVSVEPTDGWSIHT